MEESCLGLCVVLGMCFFFFKKKTAYEMRISEWSSDVCSSDLPEVGGVDLDLTELVARLGLGHAHARHRRMAEYGGRDAAIIDPAGIIAEHSVGKGLALADRDRRQLHPVGDVAHRIDAGAARAVVVVHLDRALGVECDVGRLQPEIFGMRASAGGE